MTFTKGKTHTEKCRSRFWTYKRKRTATGGVGMETKWAEIGSLYLEGKYSVMREDLGKEMGLIDLFAAQGNNFSLGYKLILRKIRAKHYFR